GRQVNALLRKAGPDPIFCNTRKFGSGPDFRKREFTRLTPIFADRSENRMIEEDGASILGKQLEESWKRYRKVLKRAKSGMTEESVHDLRVALRRLEAVVDLVPLFAPAE